MPLYKSDGTTLISTDSVANLLPPSTVVGSEVVSINPITLLAEWNRPNTWINEPRAASNYSVAVPSTDSLAASPTR